MSGHRPTTLRTRNDALLERAEPFLVAAPWHLEYLDRSPCGLSIPDENIIDPTRVAAARFLDRLAAMDGLMFGPTGMPMPRWIFYNGAEVPGAIFGFAFRAEHLPADARECLAPDDGPETLVPVSMFIAVPMRPPHRWFGHNLVSINPRFPDMGLRSLGTITKAIALESFRCREQFGATQWRSPALNIHARFGTLELITAWTPAHSNVATLTYRVEISERTLRAALGDPTVELTRHATEFEIEIEARDGTAQRELQLRLEAGERFVITDRPRRGPDDTVFVPIASLRADRQASQ